MVCTRPGADYVAPGKKANSNQISTAAITDITGVAVHTLSTRHGA
jgi:hypothetical protein